MMPSTFAYSTVLVEMECSECGIPFAMPKTLYDRCWRDHSKGFYCPNGHSLIFAGETEAVTLKRQLGYAQDSLASERARADGAEASLRSTKGHVTRLRKQVAAGRCPFCGQHLRDLGRHVTRQHAAEAELIRAEADPS